MEMLRYALGRLVAGVLFLVLFLLFQNTLTLSREMIEDSAVASASAPPPVVDLGRITSTDAHPLAEVNLRARMDWAFDVPMSGGAGRLYLLTDPADAADHPPRAAVFVAPADIAAFEALASGASGSLADGKAIVTLNGRFATPFQIDRIVAAAQAAERDLPPNLRFVEPFLTGRAAGLAPSPLVYALPAVFGLLLAALMLAETLRLIRRIRAQAILRRLQAQIAREETPEAVPGNGRDWATIAAQRGLLQRRRRDLERLSRPETAGGYGQWLCLGAIGIGGAISLLPQRPLLEALSRHVVGVDLTAMILLPSVEDWVGFADRLARVPGESLAQLVITLFGPQSLGVAGALRTLPVTVWLALAGVMGLILLRRADVRRSERGSLH